jgi:plasmid stabilization system protein ParE
MTPLRFLPEATAEAREAARWYEERREGLGSEFIVALMERARRAEMMPGAGRLARGAPERFQLRWYVLERFPYSLLVGTGGEERVVVAVAHARRRPGYWRHRLVKLEP